jgi:hypothetical protein
MPLAVNPCPNGQAGLFLNQKSNILKAVSLLGSFFISRSRSQFYR